MRELHFVLLLLILGFLIAGCADPLGTPPNARSTSTDTGSQSADDQKPFEDHILAAVQNYRSYELVDGTGRWSPLRCRPPVGAPWTEFSASNEATTHGQKLYLVYAKDVTPQSEYIRPGEPARVGQVLVKESWKPEAILPEEVAKRPAFARFGNTVPSAQKDGTTYYATEPAGLFVMLKLDPKTPGTDAGWIYGTLTPDAKTVTSAGLVGSCIQCHRAAKHDHMYGLPLKPASVPARHPEQ